MRSVRKECLDHLLIINEQHLRYVLTIDGFITRPDLIKALTSRSPNYLTTNQDRVEAIFPGLVRTNCTRDSLVGRRKRNREGTGAMGLAHQFHISQNDRFLSEQIETGVSISPRSRPPDVFFRDLLVLLVGASLVLCSRLLICADLPHEPDGMVQIAREQLFDGGERIAGGSWRKRPDDVSSSLFCEFFKRTLFWFVGHGSASFLVPHLLSGRERNVFSTQFTVRRSLTLVV